MKRRNFNLGWFGPGPLGGLGLALAGLLFIGAYAAERREREGAERRVRGAAERRAGRLAWLAAERRVRGAAERRTDGLAWLAAERRVRGAAERRAGGLAWLAAERVRSGAAERRVRGAAERRVRGIAWSAADRVRSGAAERLWSGAAERRTSPLVSVFGTRWDADFGYAAGYDFGRGLQANTIFGSGQEDSLLFVWWNVQNLFDTLPNSGERDRDFLPEGMYRWNSLRYYSKLYAVGRGLSAAAGGQIPDAIGVCEIENADVLDDLERRWPPAWRLWRLHRDSPDQRGIDVAVWYNPERLRVDSVAWIHPEVNHPTREALWIRFQTPSGKSLTWLWAHLPSQRAPSPESRSLAIQTILKQCSPLPDGITGDLNEGLEGPLASELRRRNYESRYPINYPGTYAYRGRLEALDGVWIQKSARWTARSQAIPFGLQKSASAGYQIKGSFQGTRYRGGASDHLPLRIVVAAK